MTERVSLDLVESYSTKPFTRLIDHQVSELLKMKLNYETSDSKNARAISMAIEHALQSKGVYDAEAVETGMSLWEAALQMRQTCPVFQKYWEEKGTPAMRTEIMSLILLCENTWREDQFEGIAEEPFDWGHCPKFLQAHYDEVLPPKDIQKQ